LPGHGDILCAQAKNLEAAKRKHLKCGGGGGKPGESRDQAERKQGLDREREGLRQGENLRRTGGLTGVLS